MNSNGDSAVDTDATEVPDSLLLMLPQFLLLLAG